MADHYKSPAQLIYELGIEVPKDLDVEAICKYCKADVVYKRLSGCEARLTGYGDRAIITVNSTSRRPRQRFSIGHELGHWMRDRGLVAFACEEGQFVKEWSADNPETRANRYASDLLLPKNLFVPKAHGQPITFATVDTLAADFQTSRTATAIRLVEHGPLPAMLVCTSPEKRQWFVRNPDLPRALWPVDRPGQGTYAHDLLAGSDENEFSGEVDSDQWVTHDKADRYRVYEHSVRSSGGLVLSLVWWRNEKQIIDLDEEEERHAARRADSSWRR